MSCNKNKSDGAHGGNAETAKVRKLSEPEIPITIAMSSKVFNIEKQLQSGTSTSLGPALSFVKALQEVNAKLKEHYPESQELFKVLLINDSPSDFDRLNNAIGIQSEYLIHPNKTTSGMMEIYQQTSITDV
ncbi:cytosolic 5'-nucleotidase 1A-like [Scomber scombrus]|uniref:Cytosolic 5'-nucleotidase 1A-like n=1 Tax=Scomber scombrus TaxID=13677 RepID=A0AAV1QQ76_SCOSC